jgi:hypothetical protein
MVNVDYYYNSAVVNHILLTFILILNFWLFLNKNQFMKKRATEKQNWIENRCLYLISLKILQLQLTIE